MHCLSFSRFYLAVAGLNLLLTQNLFADVTEWDYSCNSALFPSIIWVFSQLLLLCFFKIIFILSFITTIRNFFLWESSLIVSCYHSEINVPTGTFDLHLIPGRIRSLWEAIKMTQMGVGILKALQSTAGWARTKTMWINCTREIAKAVGNVQVCVVNISCECFLASSRMINETSKEQMRGMIDANHYTAFTVV